ncbi:MAG: FixH family protein [Ktedonobacteraceae bacterium]|nr:FixH family protein [Ktedonobacteraceae bacterium]
MRRKLLILSLGILFLILISWLGTSITEILPTRPSSQVQTASAGPYQITMRVDPNPPPPSKPATLTLQIVHSSTRQFVTDARVTVESNMETMDMGTDIANAQSQRNGTYSVPVQFSMDGSWQVRVLVAVPGAKTESAAFEVIAH